MAMLLHSIQSLVLNVTAILITLGICYQVLVWIDKSNGVDFPSNYKLITEGNLAVAIYEAVKFFTIGYVISQVMK